MLDDIGTLFQKRNELLSSIVTKTTYQLGNLKKILSFDYALA